MNPLDSLPGMASVMLRYGVGLVLCLFNDTGFSVDIQCHVKPLLVCS